MTQDLILAGVGGQGVLSVAAILAAAAFHEGFTVRQSEVHGMAQRGGAVVAHLRISDAIICSDLIPKGNANLLISMEPLESLRYTEWLSVEGTLISAALPVVNIPNYPELNEIHTAIRSFPSHRIIDAHVLAKEAGLAKSINMVLAGAASVFLPINEKTLLSTIEEIFSAKGSAVVEANRKALYLGRKAAE